MPKKLIRTWGREQGQRLKRLRLGSSILQQAAAKAIGVSPSSLSQFEAGISEPSVGQLRLLAEYYEISLAGLLDAIGYEPHRGRSFREWWDWRKDSGFTGAQTEPQEQTDDAVKRSDGSGPGQFRARKDHSYRLSAALPAY